MKVSLLFSDIKQNLFHVFSNDCEYRIGYEQFLKDNRIKEDCTFLEYSIFDYPFENSLDEEHENKVVVEQVKQLQACLNELKGPPLDKEPGLDLLKKRDSRAELGSAGGEAESRSQKKLQTAEEEERKARLVMNKFVGMDAVGPETTAAVESFMSDLDSLVKAALDGSEKKKRSDEELIVLLTTRQLVAKYFCFTDKLYFLEEHFSLVIREKISLSHMTAALQSFRCRGPASSNDLAQLESAIPKLRLFADSLVELIVNPSNFDINSFSSRKGGKSIISVFIFMLKNFLQQSRVLEALYSENSGQNNLRGLIQEDNLRYVADSINCALNFMAYEHFREDSRLASSKLRRLAVPKPQMVTVSGELFGLQGLVQLEKTAERSLS